MACNRDTCVYIAQHFEGNTDTKFKLKNILIKFMCTLSLIVMAAFVHINLLFICSWNQPLLSNEGNISCS